MSEKNYVGFNCPLCDKRLYLDGSELLCEDDTCSYDKTLDEIVDEYCELKKYERDD